MVQTSSIPLIRLPQRRQRPPCSRTPSTAKVAPACRRSSPTPLMRITSGAKTQSASALRALQIYLIVAPRRGAWNGHRDRYVLCFHRPIGLCDLVSNMIISRVSTVGSIKDEPSWDVHVLTISNLGCPSIPAAYRQFAILGWGDDAYVRCRPGRATRFRLKMSAKADLLSAGDRRAPMGAVLCPCGRNSTDEYHENPQRRSLQGPTTLARRFAFKQGIFHLSLPIARLFHLKRNLRRS